MALTKVTSSVLNSVANTQITGLITSGQIASVANNQITGTLTGNQLGTTSDVRFNSVGVGTEATTSKIQGAITTSEINKHGIIFTKDFLGGGLDYKTASIYGTDAGQAGSGVNIGHKDSLGSSVIPLEIISNGSVVAKFTTGGALGIGITPLSQIHVYGSQPGIQVQSSTASDASFISRTTYGYWGSGTSIGESYNTWDVYDYNAGTRRLRISGSDYDAQIFFGSSNNYRFACQNDRNVVLYDGGTPVWNSGTSTSDVRLKENVSNTAMSGINTINSLRVVDFKWKANTPLYDDGVIHTGFIAQEVDVVIPDAVNDISDTFLLHKEELVPALVKAVQELSQQVKDLQTQLDSLKR